MLAGSRVAEFCRGYSTYLLQPTNSNSDSGNELHKDGDYGEVSLQRVKRSEPHYFVGRVRGQTQSQYLSFGTNQQGGGKAEAEATFGGSKAVVCMYIDTCSPLT